MEQYRSVEVRQGKEIALATLVTTISEATLASPHVIGLCEHKHQDPPSYIGKHGFAARAWSAPTTTSVKPVRG